MAQEIVTWCDLCLRDDQRQAARTVTLSINNMKPKALDLCEKHYGEFIEPVFALLAEEARPVRDADLIMGPSEGEVGAKKLRCPVPECGHMVKKRASLRDHLKSAHKTNLAEIESRMGQTVEGDPLTHPCPECDLKFAAPQGVGAHRAHVHGVEGASKGAARNRAGRDQEQEALAV